MSEIIASTKNNGKRYTHKFIKVDLTPMVDLGFLLITFFILTTSMQRPTEMNLNIPKDSVIKTPVKVSTVLTFILNRNDGISYYDGFATQIKNEGFAAMRNIIQQKQISLTQNHIDRKELTIIIKPAKESSYKNFIDAMDEITINDCKHYFVTDPGKNEVNR